VLLGAIQSIALAGSEGRISSLSMDVEATRGATAVIFFLFVCFLIAANFFATRERLRQLANFLIAFGLVLAVFALVQHFTWEGGCSGSGPRFVGHGRAVRQSKSFRRLHGNAYPDAVALALSRAARGESRLFTACRRDHGIAEVASLSRVESSA